MYLMRQIFFLCQPASLVRVGHEEGKGDVGGKGNTEYKSLSFRETTSSQAPSYASPKLRLTESLTGVKCRATSVAKKILVHQDSDVSIFVAVHTILSFLNLFADAEHN